MATSLYVGMNRGRVDAKFGKYIVNIDCGERRPGLHIFPRTYNELIAVITQFFSTYTDSEPITFIRTQTEDNIEPLSQNRFNALCRRLREYKIQLP